MGANISEGISSDIEPNKIQLKSMKEKFCSISCGSNFALFLTESGLVYSMGNSNKYGQFTKKCNNNILQINVWNFLKQG